MDLEYIRWLMLYSDQKFPFEKAKSDPGLSESVKSVNGYMKKHGNSRKFTHEEAQRILLQEKQAREGFRLERDTDDISDLDNDFTPIAERQLNEIEKKGNLQSDLENEVAMLRKALRDKEAELQARSGKEEPPKANKTPMSPKDFGGFNRGNGEIVERKLEDTGYSDEINK